MTPDKYHLVDPITKEPVHTFDRQVELRNATGMSSGSIYNRLKVNISDQKPYRVRFGPYTGDYLIANTAQLKRYTKADPNKEYVVTDGTLVYHRGSLGECKNMKQQLGFPTLKVKEWQSN